MDNQKDRYIAEITELLSMCKDTDLLDLIFRILVKSIQN